MEWIRHRFGRLDWRTAASMLVYRHILPVRSCNGCSFQFGRTSRCGPHALHFAHIIFWANDVTSTSSANFDTSITASCNLRAGVGFIVAMIGYARSISRPPETRGPTVCELGNIYG